MPQESSDALPRRRWWLKPLIILLSVVVLAGAAFWIYRATEPGRLAKQARIHLEKGDLRSAAVALRRAVAIAPRNPEVVRLMAQLADRLGAATAAAWHEQLVSLNPDSHAERAAWVGSALRLRQMDAAEEALASAPAAFRETAEHEALRGMVAIGKGHWQEAEKAFGEAVLRDPKRESYQFNYGLARAQNPDPQVRDAGFQTLRELANGRGRFAVASKRALLRLHLRQKQDEEAHRLAEEIAASSEAVFADHLARLDLLAKLKKPGFQPAMDEARTLAIKSPPDLSALLMWHVQHQMGPEAQAWTATLEPKLLEHPAVVEAQAEVLADAGDWSALADWTARKLPWARGEGMRHAFATLAADKAGRTEAAQTFWQLAVQLGVDDRERAMALAYFAHRANWRARLMEVLWASSSGSDAEWALRMLHRLCAEDNNTPGMLRVAKRLLAIRPQDEGARNNAAVLGLLLGEPPGPIVDMAKKLHESAPANPVFASTYAYALHVSGKSAEGLALFTQMAPEARAKPEIALYHAVVLAGAGKKAEAAEAAAMARQAKMLPEEEKLLANAMAGA